MQEPSYSPFGRRRQRKVDQADLGALVDEDIVRLHVPVHPPLLMHVRQRLRHALHQLLHPNPRPGQIAPQHRLQVGRTEVLHNEVSVLLRDLEVLNLDDVRMVELLPDRRFMLERRLVIGNSEPELVFGRVALHAVAVRIRLVKMNRLHGGIGRNAPVMGVVLPHVSHTADLGRDGSEHPIVGVADVTALASE